MSIYRGAGGAGDAVADSSSEALLIRDLVAEADADAVAAAASASAAAASAAAASSSASSASTSASNAATSATNASNSASSASTSATNAANSATAAQTAETAAELAETNAETAETNAAASASSASTSATNASNSATSASTSASTATTQASNASTSATNAANSATSAATSATNAANSATLAASYTPSQIGNSGKYLTTDGTNTSWDALATVANSGSYNDLSDKPTIPTNLDSLTDVTVTSPTTDQVLKYNGSSWVNGAAASSYNGMKNRIINGDMRIDQRNAGASVSVGTSSPYGVDRWKFEASQASKLTMQQNAGSVSPPAGFVNYFGMTSSSAYSVLSSDYFWLEQFVEGFNTADLAWGTASAKTITISFWVRSSLTGSFGASITNVDVTRCYPFNYTISSANTWEQKTVTITGDTTGTWNTGNSTGIRLHLNLGTGSTRLGSSSAWGSSDYRGGLTGATSVVGTNGATFYLTGVQLEVGSSATPFDTRAYGTELALCKRYYDQQKSTQLRMYLSNGNDVTDDLFRQLSIFFKEEMRTAPTVTFNATLTGATLNGTSTFGTTTTSTCLQTQGSDTSHFAATTEWTASAEL